MTEAAQQLNPPSPEAAAPVQVLAVNDPRRKSPFLACVLSTVMPGLGQVYTGYYQRGFAHAIIVAILIAFLVSNNVVPLYPLAGIFLAFFLLYNIVDAGRRATLFNEILAGRKGVELPKDLEMPAMGGSVAGGVALVAIGFILLVHTRFDVSLDWLAEWWPIALIGFGAYLAYKAVKEKGATKNSSWNEEVEE